MNYIYIKQGERPRTAVYNLNDGPKPDWYDGPTKPYWSIFTGKREGDLRKYITVSAMDAAMAKIGFKRLEQVKGEAV
jgi:hypothetical protein